MRYREKTLSHKIIKSSRDKSLQVRISSLPLLTLNTFYDSINGEWLNIMVTDACIRFVSSMRMQRHTYTRFNKLRGIRYFFKSLYPLKNLNHFGNTRFKSKVEHIIERCSILWMRAVRTGTGRLRQGFSVLTPMTSIVWKTNMIELVGFVYNRYGLRKVFSTSCLQVL